LHLLDVGCGAAGYLLGQSQVSLVKKWFCTSPYQGDEAAEIFF
jgi:hypothetical protein